MKIKFTTVTVAILFWATVGNCGPNGGVSSAFNPLNSDPTGAGALARQRAVEWEYAQEKARHDFVPLNPWRAINGATNYVKVHGVEFCGKVVDVTKDGVRIDGEFANLFEANYSPSLYEYHDFFVANYPFDVVNDHVISESEHQMAWYVGTYTYSTVNGGSRTIKKLDYGIPCGIPPELIKQQIEAAKVRAELIKKKTEQGKINAFKWLQTQVTNGYPSDQYSLGLHYLKGEGCETNQDQGIYWLKKAAEQGSLEASNKLEQLKQQK